MFDVFFLLVDVGSLHDPPYWGTWPWCFPEPRGHQVASNGWGDTLWTSKTRKSCSKGSEINNEATFVFCWSIWFLNLHMIRLILSFSVIRRKKKHEPSFGKNMNIHELINPTIAATKNSELIVTSSNILHNQHDNNNSIYDHQWSSEWGDGCWEGEALRPSSRALWTSGATHGVADESGGWVCFCGLQAWNMFEPLMHFIPVYICPLYMNICQFYH